MKKFYAWYQKHITGAIFIGLLLGILTGLFLADRFAPVLTVTSLLGGIYMNALNMMIFPLYSVPLLWESAASEVLKPPVRLPVLPWYFSFVQLHSPALPV